MPEATFAEHLDTSFKASILGAIFLLWLYVFQRVLIPLAAALILCQACEPLCLCVERLFSGSRRRDAAQELRLMEDGHEVADAQVQRCPRVRKLGVRMAIAILMYASLACVLWGIASSIADIKWEQYTHSSRITHLSRWIQGHVPEAYRHAVGPSALADFLKAPVGKVILLLGGFAEGSILTFVLFAVVLVSFSNEPQGERVVKGRVQKYLVLKTAASLLVGIIEALTLISIGFDLWLVFSFISFLLNYVPVVGIISIILPLPLIWLDPHQTVAQLLCAFFFPSAYHICSAFLIEPHLFRKLDLSPILSILSIGTWGVLWGLNGALLGIPLTLGSLEMLGFFAKNDSTLFLLHAFLQEKDT